MKQSASTSLLSHGSWRFLRNTPAYFFIVWRWAWWFYALVVIFYFPPLYQQRPGDLSYWNISTILLVITFLQTVLVTLYTPLTRFLARHRLSGSSQRASDMLSHPSVRNIYWDICIFGLDLLICGLVMYFSGSFAYPPFGVGSPFYRYALSSIFAVAFAYHFRGGLIAALGFDLFVVLGWLVQAPGSIPDYKANIVDIAGSLMDAPLVAVLAAYLASLLSNYLQSQQELRDQFEAHTQQQIELAVAQERDRIAREIHDGIAQLIYMLSLQAETASTQAERLAASSTEVREQLLPLVERLQKQVTISKQALWETRNYMFSLKPLMHGSTNLRQMLENQAREFQHITDLPVHFQVEGFEQLQEERRKQQTQVDVALFRIVQEALTNAYKHADASQLEVALRYVQGSVQVEVQDDGKGLPVQPQGERIYSGLGIQGMQRRVEELDGQLSIQEREEGGIRIQVSMPYEENK